MAVVGKKRGCRNCGAEYTVPSETPGTCSQECFVERHGGRKVQRAVKKAHSVSFYTSREWLSLRFKALNEYGRKCSLCLSSKSELHVDHIKPRSKFPELALQLDNLQILCRSCNLGKGTNSSYTRF